MPQGQTALDWVLGDEAAPKQTALDWVLGDESAPAPPDLSIPDIGAQAKFSPPRGDFDAQSAPFTPLMQGGAAPTQGPSGQTLGGMALNGLEDVVRGAEVHGGRMLKFGGQEYARLRNAVYQGDQTRAELGRNVQRAGKPGEALTAQGLSHPEPTTFGGKALENLGAVGSIAATGPLGLTLTAGASVEERYNETLKATGSEPAAFQAAVSEIPIQALYLAPVARIFMGSTEGASLARKVLDAAVTGAVGPGAARIVGEVVGEHASKQDKADLVEALKRGGTEALKESPMNATVFALLGGIAGVAEPARAVPVAEKPVLEESKPVDGQPEAPAAEAPRTAPGPSVQLEQPAKEPLAVAPEVPGESVPTTEVQKVPQEEVVPTIKVQEPAAPPAEAAKEPEPAPPAPSEPPPGAAPAEPERVPTSLKEAAVTEERATRGLDPIEKTAARGYEDVVWPEATKRMEADPGLGERLAAEIAEKPRPLSDLDVAILLRNKVAAHNETARVESELLKAQESGDPLAVESLKLQQKHLSDKNLKAEISARYATGETGRGLAAIRMMANHDYSLAALETRARIKAGGRPLTEPEHAELAEMSKRLIAAEQQVADYEAKAREAEAAQSAKAIKKDPERQAKLLSFLDAQAEQARARIKARGTRAMAGIDPADLADRVTVGVNYLAHDVAAFAEWSSKMLGEFGEAIKPHLEDIYARAKDAYAQAIKLPSRQQAQKTRMRGAIGKLESKLAEPDFTPPAKTLRTPVPLDAEGVKLKANLEELRRTLQRRIDKYEHEHRTTLQKTKHVAQEIVDLPKAMMTAFDLSATLRQGAVFSLDPSNAKKLVTKWIPKQISALMSERKALEIDVALRNRPHAALGDRAGLELTQLGDAPGKHEEAIRSRWSDKIPGLKASNRAFTTFLNMQRADMFDKFVEALPGAPTLEEAKALANMVNIGTGRGDPGKFAGAVSAASHVLWSPRLLLSRFQLLAGQPLYRGTAETRTIIAKQYARSLAGAATLYALGALIGAEEENDPRSSDFGKLKFGNSRLDPLGGLAQVTVLGSRVFSGETKTLGGQVRPIRPPIFGEGKGPAYGQADTADILTRFLRTKLSPTLGVPIDVLTGKDVVGQPVTPLSAAKGLAVPLSFQDIFKAMQEQGIPRGAAMGVLSLFGMGLQNYSDAGAPKLRLNTRSHNPPRR